ncbi:hypothetical protein MNQ98_18455 [Paenibacillus sp. N3/727]|uniref:hypothetical protein n=1 Tax=Paenibacillus sp. N3/727 TaxID=2925845 RepID=UPI001F52DCCC|nr:hypothetical protein [Paenibacillus sp. N3/727]UNK16479.1 hypothetical protein MNQ98_18455 [Paenibacillus sp. N3/727]
MKRNLQHVPYGYESPKEGVKGTLIYYDIFENARESDLDIAFGLLESQSFAKLVLYPLHEETVKRMSKEPASAFYKREKPLVAWTEELNRRNVIVELWEGKRKKYTPIDAALRHLTDKYQAPHFVYMSPEMANVFASFSSFEEWIVKLRLILSSKPEQVHSRLEKFSHRWDSVEEVQARKS